MPATRLVRRRTPAAVALLASTVAFGLAFQPEPAAADDLVVKYDQSQLWQLPRTPAEIIIGNPTIADIAIQGGGLLVITGKSFGITNVIALDAERKVIEERRLLVQRDEVRVVNLHKAGKRESYNCSPQCNPTITVGDDPQYFEVVAKTSERKIKMSEGQSDPNGGGGPQQ